MVAADIGHGAARPLIALSWSSYCSAATIYRKRDIGRIISVLYPVCAPVQPIDAQLSEAGSRTLLEVYQLRSPILVQDSRFRSAVDVYKALTLQHGLANGCLYREYDDFVEVRAAMPSRRLACTPASCLDTRKLSP